MLYAVGAGTVSDLGLKDYLLGQLMVTSAQVTAHFVNEFADIEIDRHVVNRTWFSGGSGVLSSGTLPARVAMRAAIASSTMAVVFAVLVADRSGAAAALGLIALVVSWLYSLPPVRLLDTAWGEAMTSVVVAVLVPFIGALANGGEVTAPLRWAVVVLFLVHMAMMLALELPDLETDRAGGKTVLAVRLGHGATWLLIVAFFGLAAAAAALAGSAGQISTPWRLVPAGISALLVVIAARWQRFHMATWSAVGTLALAALALVGSL